MSQIFALIFFAIAFNVHAEWRKVAGTDDATVYVEVDRIRYDGDVANVWTMTSYQSPQRADGVSFRSIKSRNRFDCKAETRQEVATARYSLNAGEGRSVYSSNDVQNVRSIVPNSLADTVYKLVCSKPKTSQALSGWVEFGENERLVSYYEPHTERRGTTVLVWVLFNYKSEQLSVLSGRRYFSEKDRQEIDCQEARSRTVFYTWHEGQLGNGKVVYSGNTARECEPNSPGGIGRTLASIVCKN